MQNTPSELNLVEKIKKLVKRNHPRTVVGLGDDGFVYKSFSDNTVLAQDLMIENVHFQRNYFSAADLGFKALAVNLSDLAAMGARPQFAQVSLAFPKDIDEAWILSFYSGMLSLADQHKVEIVGGDLSASPGPIVVDVSVVGEVSEPFVRSGAQAGDLLAVTGPLGLSKAGMLALQKELYIYAEATQKHLRPKPRLDISTLLKRHSLGSDHIHAMLDISDGLINDTLHLTRQLQLGVEIRTADIPLDSESEGMALSLGQNALDWALWGGEDYELLMAIPANKKDEVKYVFENEDQDLFFIGKFNESREISLLDAEGKSVEIKEYKGWRHF